MTFQTVKDIVDHARRLHEALSRQYAELEQLTTSERAQLLLDYLHRHERRLAEALRDYEADAAHGILETWLQYAPKLDSGPLLERIRTVDLNDVEAVVAAALAVDDYLLKVFQEIEEQAEVETLREVARSLQQIERNEEHLLARDALRLHDY
ncbi:MAG: hypothetical protein ACOY42_08355 [Pseudomonadota bacterium]